MQKAVRLALKLKGIDYIGIDKQRVEIDVKTTSLPEISQQVHDLLNTKPRVVNVGLKSFTDSIIEHGAKTVQYDWNLRQEETRSLLKY